MAAVVANLLVGAAASVEKWNASGNTKERNECMLSWQMECSIWMTWSMVLRRRNDYDCLEGGIETAVKHQEHMGFDGMANF